VQLTDDQHFLTAKGAYAIVSSQPQTQHACYDWIQQSRLPDRCAFREAAAIWHEIAEQRSAGFRNCGMASDLRFALRMILAHRWFSAALVATLALGIGLNTMVFTLVNAVLFKPVPVPGGARLVSIVSRSLAQGDRYLPMSYPDFQDFRVQAQSFESFEAAIDQAGILSEPGASPQSYHLEQATPGIFSMLHTQAILGRGFLPGDDRPGADPVLVIGYNVWQERYAGVPDILGRQIHVNGKPATIIGVMPKGFRFPTNVDLWMPLIPTPDLAKRDNRPIHAYAILKPSSNLREAAPELDSIARRLALQYPADKDVGASVLTFQQRFNGGGIRMIFLLMLAAVGFVLLIACADVANMMLSRALGRQREMSIRTALGASRWRVVRQLLIESVLLSILGGLVGLSLAALGAHWFDLSTRVVRPYWIQFTMDYSVFGYCAALCILSGLLFGTAPALRASRIDLMEILKEGSRSVGRHRGGWLSATLVVFQFAVTLVLLTGAGIFVCGLLTSLSVNPFIPASQLTTARLQLPDTRYKDADARQRFYDQLLPRLRAVPGVMHAAIVSDAPGLGAPRQQIELEHTSFDNPAKRPWIALVAESPDAFETIHLPLLRGRGFSTIDGSPSHEAAVLTRDAAARFWPNKDPIGRRFRLYDDKNKPTDWITVVGISADMVQELVDNDPKPLLFVPFRQEGWSNMALLAESSTNPLPAMRAAVQAVDPDLPLSDPYRLDQAIEHQVWFLSLFGKIFLVFALIALLMASVGIYAVIAHATSSRTQEIGVRMALGASIRNILLLVMTRGLWQIAAGLAFGLAASLPLTRLMASLPIGVSHSDPTVVLTVAVVLASVGLLACWLPARRAAALDPVKAIRYE
jgi:putative ABC transport system permease protein